jgi:hypothetical protein
VCRAHPPATEGDGAHIDTLNAQTLKPLYSTDYVDEGVRGADFVQSHSLGGDTVHVAFLFAEKLERAHRAFTYPGTERRGLEPRYQLRKVVMNAGSRPVRMGVGGMVMSIVILVSLMSMGGDVSWAGQLRGGSRRAERDHGTDDAAPEGAFELHLHLRETEAAGEAE